MSKLHGEAAESEVAHSVGSLDELAVDDVRGLLVLIVKDETSHLCQIAKGRGTVVVVWSTAPECLFVELYLFCLCAAKDHSSHAGITYGESLEPHRCGCVIPEALVVVNFSCRQGYRCHKKHKGHERDKKLFHCILG